MAKKLLKLSSLLIAVIMLVLTMFTGVVSAEQADDFGTGNTIEIKGKSWLQCGQNVVLEAGKTYLYSYYHSGPKSIGGVIYAGLEATKPITPIATYVDQDYKKVTYKFVAPEDATPAEEEGKVKIYLGFQVPSADPQYIYYPCVYAIDDETKTNLFFDYLITGKYSVANKDGGNDGKVNWYKPYGDAKLAANQIARPTLESVGGLDIFKKTDAEKNVIALASGASMSKAFFGQKIALEGGKTYVFSNYYSGALNKHVFRKDDGSYTDVDADLSNTDTNVRKITSVFTVPTDMVENADGTKPFWVGMQCASNSGSLNYFYGLRLYDIEHPEINLLQDADLALNDTKFDAMWRKPSSGLEAGYFTKTNLAAVGGMEIFNKTDADRYVLRLKPQTSKQPFFGQRVLLVPGKTYEFSNYFLSNYPANPSICYPNTTAIETEVTVDEKYSKQTVKFTVPADAPIEENGKALIFVGFRGNFSDTPLYYFDLRLYDVMNPELNLLKDADLSGAGFEVKSDTWKTPGGNYINNNTVGEIYTDVTLESIGGINAFLPYEVKCDLTGDGKVDIRDLVRMKRYSVGAVETLLEGAGDLDCDTEFAGSSDLVLLTKEILK